MGYTNLLLRLCFVAALSVVCGATVNAADTTGVVLLHGKTGMPGQMAKLASALTAAGYAVETPEMCWSKKRIFDETFTDCLRDVDMAIVTLKTNGASRIVVAGVSQGAMAAFAYGVAHPDIAGIVAMAPAGDPPDLSKAPDLAASVKSALALAKAGKGDAVADFNDVITGNKPIAIKATPRAFLSFHDPQSPTATMKQLLGKVLPHVTVPVLWVAGTRDPTQGGAPQGFARIQKNKLSQLVNVDADHGGTPDASGGAVVAWLSQLK
jgi:pimeloyl-ACP methyl ester carboxylesterase